MITIGIDPGWASFGIAINKDDVLLGTSGFIPREYTSIHEFILVLENWIKQTVEQSSIREIDNLNIYIERFVTYSGTQTDPENILMLIGALDYFFTRENSKPSLIRALDWKVRLCHYIVKTTNQSNPSKKFDKKYSIWAAEMLSGVKFKSDHEADAVCLSYMTPARR